MTRPTLFTTCSKFVTALVLLALTAACTPTGTETSWNGGYDAVPLPASKVAAMGPSAGIF